ncbi:MAG: septation protein SpoVG family protein [Parcubacteria group bacterium]|nr:septation protein SpoVG family protein [Parcubacteria group bacterium]
MTKQNNTQVPDIEVVDIRKITGDGNLKAFADLKIGGSVIVKGFNVLKGKQGVFVAMPRKASKDGRWFDILTPVNDEVKNKIETKILEAYDQEGA